jgi:uncharacterized protein YneF (UPF0154 family)
LRCDCWLFFIIIDLSFGRLVFGHIVGHFVRKNLFDQFEKTPGLLKNVVNIFDE